MLVSLLVTLVAERAGVLPQAVGRANYAVVLERLNAVAAGLGDRLHAQEGPKPLTCSDLFFVGQIGQEKQGARRHQEAQTLVQAGDRYQVHITGLTESVSRALLLSLVEQPPALWPLHSCPLRVAQVVCDDEVDCWTGCTSFEQLAAKPILAGRGLGPQVTLVFLSPTSFQSNGLHMPLPLPNLVFGSLVDRWNAFSPLVKVAGELRGLLAEKVAISQFELRSQAVAQKNGKDGQRRGATPLHIGGEGWVTYALVDKGADQRLAGELLGKLQMLANFAMYSGVGVKTTVGMGQCRRVVRE